FAAALTAAGFEPIYFPVIEIRPMEDNTALDRALQKLTCYDWVVFTSVNGVEAVWEHLPPLPAPFGGASRGEGLGVRVAAIGPKTADALRTRGVNPDFVPDEYVAEAILPGLGDLRGRWVLLPRAEIAREALPKAIVKADGVAHEIAVYHTLPAEPDPAGLAALRSGVDVVTLTSPSTVQNFVAIVRQHGLDPLRLPGNPVFACIGPITEQAARDEGLNNLVMADEYTTEGLIQVIVKLVNQ
ncbi:MAG: HemD protein, partial [Anaerolinea sp.]|nr:HemD protein [Anaerolinea sp.]